MFVRFRQSDRRLQASLAETRRQDGKVRHEHVAGLGSVPIALSPTDRLAFWTKLHQRLDALSNRVDAAQRGAILTAIHARIPMPTLDDQQAVQLERAQADARFWETLAEMHADDIEGHKTLLAMAQRKIAEREPLAADTAAKAQAAKDRLALVEKGEAVAGIPAPMTRADLLEDLWHDGGPSAALRARCRDRRGRRGLVAADDRRTATAQGESREGGGQAAAPYGDRGWPMSDLCDYATDVAAWAEQQAGLLRRRASGQLPNDAGLDWDNLAEEIEGVAASQKREIRNRLKRICQHLLKWRHSKRPPSRSWRERSMSSASSWRICSRIVRRCAGSPLTRYRQRLSTDAAPRSGRPAHSSWLTMSAPGRWNRSSRWTSFRIGCWPQCRRRGPDPGADRHGASTIRAGPDQYGSPAHGLPPQRPDCDRVASQNRDRERAAMTRIDMTCRDPRGGLPLAPDWWGQAIPRPGGIRRAICTNSCNR